MNFVLVMHTPLAKAMEDVLQHVLPDLCEQLQQNNSLKIIDICPHHCLDQQKQKIYDAIIHNDGHDTLLLNDLFGATPHRLMNEVMSEFSNNFPDKSDFIHSLSGVNIPIFLRAVKSGINIKNIRNIKNIENNNQHKHIESDLLWSDFIADITKNNACII